MLNQTHTIEQIKEKMDMCLLFCKELNLDSKKQFKKSVWTSFKPLQDNKLFLGLTHQLFNNQNIEYIYNDDFIFNIAIPYQSLENVKALCVNYSDNIITDKQISLKYNDINITLIPMTFNKNEPSEYLKFINSFDFNDHLYETTLPSPVTISFLIDTKYKSYYVNDNKLGRVDDDNVIIANTPDKQVAITSIVTCRLNHILHKYLIWAIAKTANHDLEVVTPTSNDDKIKISKKYLNRDKNIFTFNLYKGLRYKFEQVKLLDNDYIKEIQGDYEYITSPKGIINTLFSNIEKEDINRYNSISDIIYLISKYKNNEIDSIYNNLLLILFGLGSQAIDVNPIKDAQYKLALCRLYEDSLKPSFNIYSVETSMMIDNYYRTFHNRGNIKCLKNYL